MLSFLLETGFGLLVVTPLILFFWKKSSSFTSLAVFLIYYFLDNLATSLPFLFESIDFIDTSMNWEGKIASYLLAVTMIVIHPQLSAQNIGFTLKQTPGSERFSKITVLVIFILFLIYSLLIGGYSGGLENILFQLTMPAIVEEIAYRGIMMTILSSFLTKNIQWGKTSFGGSVLVTSVLFGLWHGLTITSDFQIEMAWFPLVFTGLIGFLLGIVRERTGSLLVPVLLHLIINVVPNLIGYLF